MSRHGHLAAAVEATMVRVVRSAHTAPRVDRQCATNVISQDIGLARVRMSLPAVGELPPAAVEHPVG